MASEQAIGMLSGQAMAALVAEMGQLAAFTGLTVPDLPTDRDPRLQAAKRLDVLARFMAQANEALAKQAKDRAAVADKPLASKEKDK